jgi:hypothetical protein
MRSNRLLLGLGVLLACALNAGCISVHKDVFRSHLAGADGSLYANLKNRLEKGPIEQDLGERRDSIAALLDSTFAKVMEDSLVAYSPLGALDEKVPADVACLARDAKIDFKTIERVKERVKSLRVRLGEIKDFLRLIIELPRAGGGSISPMLLPLQIPPPSGPDDLSLLHFLGGYLSAYANGTFVNRNGNGFSKPSLDSGKSSIGNDTITAFVSVVGEAVADHFFYRHRACVQYPIVLGAEDGKPVWLTVGGGMPTLARLVGLDEHTTPDKIPETLKGFVEAAKDDDARDGIGPRKLKLIRLVGSVSGDEGKLVSGLVLRNVGGIEFGQFLFGKWSIGDNETLSKVAETIFGLLARRTNESVASHVLYRRPIPGDLDWILQAVGKADGS